MTEGKARCEACGVEFKAKKDGLPYAHKCVPALNPKFVAPFKGK